MDRIDGRVALVTGSAGGIGLAVATELLRSGARVVLADINETALRAAADPLGSNAAGFVLDVGDRGQWADAKRFAEKHFGPVEILVCNAGIPQGGTSIPDLDPAEFERALRVNLWGVFNGVSMLAGDMRARRDGHIVGTSSMAGIVPFANAAGYVASKFGVVGILAGLRAEMAPHNVGVSVLCPGLVRTPMTLATVAAARAKAGGPATLDEGLDAAIVGAQVVDGIRTNRAHIFTHGDYRPLITNYYQQILADIEDVPVRGGIELVRGKQ